MSITIYVVSAVLVFVFSGLLAMAGLGTAFLFVPLFYYQGVPLAEATPTALLLNVVSLAFAAVNYWRGKLIQLAGGAAGAGDGRGGFDAGFVVDEDQNFEHAVEKGDRGVVVPDRCKDDFRSNQVSIERGRLLQGANFFHPTTLST